MDRAPAHAPVESLVRRYLHGSRLLPLDSGGSYKPNRQAAAERAPRKRFKPHRQLQP
jgi:hypothetical protein